MRVKLGNGLRQRICRNAHLTGQTFDGRIDHIAIEVVIQIILQGLFAQTVHLIGIFAAEDVVNQTIRLRNHRLGHFVAAAVLADKALAFLVDKAVGRGDIKRRASLRIAERKQLNLIHIHQIRTDGFSHKDAVAGYAGHIGCRQRRAEIRPLFTFAIFLAQLDITRKAAGRNDNALVGHQGNSIAFLAGCVHANHLVSIGNQADAGGYPS